MKILAIDHGTKRLGFAISDEFGQFAAALPVITLGRLDTDVTVTVQVIDDQKPEMLLVGLPLGMAGKPTSQSKIVLKFVTALRNSFPGKIVTWDETYTSVQAAQLMTNSNKAIDSKAAQIMLQTYLDFIKTGI